MSQTTALLCEGDSRKPGCNEPVAPPTRYEDVVKLRQQVAPVVLITRWGDTEGVTSMQPKRTTSGSVQRICGACQAVFYTFPSRVKSGEAIACSRRCDGAIRRRTALMHTADRVWAKIDQCGPIPARRPELGPCWMWLGVMSRGGYGRIAIASRQLQAHRVVWEMVRGPIPEGLHLDHLCLVTLCVRPDHLEPVTQGTNILRGESPHAVNARKEQCANGHSDWVVREGGWRRCRACHRAADRRYRQRQATSGRAGD